jgi:NAD+ kinase
LSFEVKGRTENFLCTLDSRYEVITAEHQLAIRKCDFGIRLIQLQPSSFLKTMHDKLNWGLDRRN